MSGQSAVNAVLAHLPGASAKVSADRVPHGMEGDGSLFGASGAAQFLLITAHDFRSQRKANMHFIAAELAKRGSTRMFSLGFSRISRMRGRDSRLGLESRANRVELVDGVECYLWMTPVHPGNLKTPLAEGIAAALFNLYARSVPAIFLQWVRDAKTIILESGLGVLFIEQIRKINPEVELLYIASDDLETIGAAPYLQKRLSQAGPFLDGARVPSRRLAAIIPPGPLTYYVPHGMDPDVEGDGDPSPYSGGINAVSVGSMLFDPSFFHIAAQAFPQVTFHVIGSGARRSALPAEVVYHDEMAYKQTLPFLKHADFGIAPYRRANLPYYLCDTSMKLIQYEHYQLPAVCPSFVVGDDHPGRFGYEPGDAQSIRAAIDAALAADPKTTPRPLTWREVVDRILDPGLSPDTMV